MTVNFHLKRFSGVHRGRDIGDRSPLDPFIFFLEYFAFVVVFLMKIFLIDYIFTFDNRIKDYTIALCAVFTI